MLSNCIKKVNGSTETPEGEESNHYAEILHLLYRLTTSFCQTCPVKLFLEEAAAVATSVIEAFVSSRSGSGTGSDQFGRGGGLN